MYYDLSFILLIPAIIFSLIASTRVRSTFASYGQVRNYRNLTGAQAARMMLDANGLNDVAIEPIRGSLTDNYDPRIRTLHLSESVMNVPSVSAVSVACHEAGHALQHAYGYSPLAIRTAIVPLANFASRLTWILIFAGLILMSAANRDMGGLGNSLFTAGVVAYLVVILFQLLTLPVEFNASSRALEQMETLGIVAGEEQKGAKKVLSAAAMTYVAAAAVSLLQLLRILMIRGRR
ncbi:MAG: zinc metallopeptidase [Clostridia bacterium]|nr:zinc metallopeptidase [Clostridia bacterium]